MQCSHTSMSFSTRRRQSDSSELDVFDASRYFSGCIDGVGFGFGYGYNSTTMSSHRPIVMKKSLEMMASLPCQKVESTINEEKKFKQPISPGRKFATFLNSLFQQKPSNKKKNNQKSLMQKVDQSSGQRTANSEHKGRKIAKSLKSFNSTAFGEKKWLLRRNVDELMVRKREEAEIRKKENRDEESFDHESDSSSDLFELKSYDFADFSYGLPVYQTTKAGVIKRGASVKFF
ncbi:protein BIG GRAIN 1-like C [Dendrobium catenatum]|nr:protein BIG GRAIN 1-like C [Dendrobium catenatum]